MQKGPFYCKYFKEFLSFIVLDKMDTIIYLEKESCDRKLMDGSFTCSDLCAVAIL